MINITRNFSIHIFIMNNVKMTFCITFLFLIIGCNDNDVFKEKIANPQSRWVLRDTLDTKFVKLGEVYGFNKFNKDGSIDTYFFKNNKEIKFSSFEKQNVKNGGWKYLSNDSILYIYERKFKVQKIKKEYILLKNLQNSKHAYLIDTACLSGVIIR